MTEAHAGAPRQRLAGAVQEQVTRDRDRMSLFYGELLADFARLQDGRRARRASRLEDLDGEWR